MDGRFLENEYLSLCCDKIDMNVKEIEIFKLSYIFEDNCVIVTLAKREVSPTVSKYIIVNNPVGLEAQSEDLTFNTVEINPQNDYSFLREYAEATHVVELSLIHNKKLQCIRLYDYVDTFANITVDIINENTLELVESISKWGFNEMKRTLHTPITFKEFMEIYDVKDITQIDYAWQTVEINANRMKYDVTDAKYWKVSKLKEKCQDLRVEFIENSPYVKEAVHFNCDVFIHEKDLCHARIYLEEYMIDIILDAPSE
ncbi:MAG: hypothetical protein ACRCV7_06875 [Culicoidibacterales bacterium]